MKLIHEFCRRGISVVMVLLLLVCIAQPAFAQRKNIFDQISDGVDNLTESAKRTSKSAERLRDKLDNLSDMGLLSKEEFARQVCVNRLN